MNKYNLSENSIRNVVSGITLKSLNLIGGFLTRTLLIYSLGMEYVGLDGLFSSVLMILNTAELGFSSAVVFKLYKPIAENKKDEVCSLIKYYRDIYRTIGIVIFSVGIIILPFIERFVRNEIPDDLNIKLLFFIYLLNTCLSYWMFAYKTALINAHQRNDLGSKIGSIVVILKYIVQISILLTVHSYYVYVAVLPLMTLLTNIGNAILVKKKYPQYICKGKISSNDKKEVKDKVAALFLNKLGVVLINGSDNIIISYFLGLTILGMYSSYYYIFSMIYSFLDILYASITGGVGNRIVTESVERNYSLFRFVDFSNSWLVGWCSICLFCLYNPFITLWIGDTEIFSEFFVLLMALYFYFWMIRFTVIIFKNAQGLWWEDRFRAMIEGGVNLTLNIFLVQRIGIYGIVLSTIIAMLLISLPWETKVLFEKYFCVSDYDYYKSMLKRLLITMMTGFATYIICNLLIRNDWITFLFKVLICLIFPNVCWMLIYRRDTEYIKLKKWLSIKFNMGIQKFK